MMKNKQTKKTGKNDHNLAVITLTDKLSQTIAYFPTASALAVLSFLLSHHC